MPCLNKDDPRLKPWRVFEPICDLVSFCAMRFPELSCIHRLMSTRFPNVCAALITHGSLLRQIALTEWKNGLCVRVRDGNKVVTCRCGETADTHGSEPCPRKGVWVQIPPAAPS